MPKDTRPKCIIGVGCHGSGFTGWSNIYGVIRCDCEEGEKHAIFYPTGAQVGEMARGDNCPSP